MEEGIELKMGEEFGGLDFHSSRLERRFIKTMETLAGQPDKSIWSCSENRAEAKAIYRMMGNERLDEAEILRTHREATIKRMKGSSKTILVPHEAKNPLKKSRNSSINKGRREK